MVLRFVTDLSGAHLSIASRRDVREFNCIFMVHVFDLCDYLRGSGAAVLEVQNRRNILLCSERGARAGQGLVAGLQVPYSAAWYCGRL